MLPYRLPLGVHLHRLEVGEQHVAVLDGRLLLAKEHLGGAQAQRIVAAVEQVAQDHVRQLVDEHAAGCRSAP